MLTLSKCRAPVLVHPLASLAVALLLAACSPSQTETEAEAPQVTPAWATHFETLQAEYLSVATELQVLTQELLEHPNKQRIKDLSATYAPGENPSPEDVQLLEQIRADGEALTEKLTEFQQRLMFVNTELHAYTLAILDHCGIEGELRDESEMLVRFYIGLTPGAEERYEARKSAYDDGMPSYGVDTGACHRISERLQQTGTPRVPVLKPAS